jgi:hypothetical protein
MRQRCVPEHDNLHLHACIYHVTWVASFLHVVGASHCACEQRRFKFIYCVGEQTMALRHDN